MFLNSDILIFKNYTEGINLNGFVSIEMTNSIFKIKKSL